MATARCTGCRIDYPGHFITCLVKECRQKLLPAPYGEPDPGWNDLVKKRNETGGVVIHTDRHGEKWLSTEDAARLPYGVTTGTILELGDAFYEVNGKNAAGDRFWLEEVIVDGAADSLEPSMFLAP